MTGVISSILFICCSRMAPSEAVKWIFDFLKKVRKNTKKKQQLLVMHDEKKNNGRNKKNSRP